eukprot:1144869-Pelagomonas_calceolata.AAC.1
MEFASEVSVRNMGQGFLSKLKACFLCRDLQQVPNHRIQAVLVTFWLQHSPPKCEFCNVMYNFSLTVFLASPLRCQAAAVLNLPGRLSGPGFQSKNSTDIYSLSQPYLAPCLTL